jgi:hypothetical protein
MIINIITAVSRPHNLKLIKDNLKSVFTKCEVRWYLIFDSLKVDYFVPEDCYYFDFIPGDISGAPQKNRALDLIKEGWVYFLDDDNLMHEEYENAFLENSNKVRNCNIGGIKCKIPVQGLVFSQLFVNGIRSIAGPSGIDCAQFTFDRDIVEDARFPLDCYESDKGFFNGVYKKHRDKILFHDKLVTYYNAIV